MSRADHPSAMQWTPDDDAQVRQLVDAHRPYNYESREHAQERRLDEVLADLRATAVEQRRLIQSDRERVLDLLCAICLISILISVVFTVALARGWVAW